MYVSPSHSTVPSSRGPEEAALWQHSRLVVFGLSALWNAVWFGEFSRESLSSTIIGLEAYRSDHNQVLVQPSQKNVPLLLSYSLRSTAGTHMRCMTTSSTSPWCSVPVGPAQPGPSSKLCWRRRAPRGWAPETTLWVTIVSVVNLLNLWCYQPKTFLKIYISVIHTYNQIHIVTTVTSQYSLLCYYDHDH